MYTADLPLVPLTTLLTFVILLVALQISASTTVKDMINLYRLQAALIALVVILTVAEHSGLNIPLAIVALPPVLLVWTVKPLLGRATLAMQGEVPRGATGLRPWTRELLTSLRDAPRKADLIWLSHGNSRLALPVSIGIDLALIVFSFVVAYLLSKGPPSRIDPHSVVESLTLLHLAKGHLPRIDPQSVAISLALLLLGIVIMINRRDILAQIIGLLVMEHGLILVAIQVITNLSLAIYFALSIISYTLITLVIFVWLLPALHRQSGSIDLDEQRQLKG